MTTTHDTHHQGGGTAEALRVSSAGALLPTLIKPGERLFCIHGELRAFDGPWWVYLCCRYPLAGLVTMWAQACMFSWAVWNTHGLAVPVGAVFLATIVLYVLSWMMGDDRAVRIPNASHLAEIRPERGQSFELAARVTLLCHLLTRAQVDRERVTWLATETLDVAAQELERSVRGLTQSNTRAVALGNLLGDAEYRGPALLIIRTLANTARGDQRQLACTCLDKLHARYTADQEAAAQERAARRAVEKAAAQELEPDLSDVFDLILDTPNPTR